MPPPPHSSILAAVSQVETFAADHALPHTVFLDCLGLGNRPLGLVPSPQITFDQYVDRFIAISKGNSPATHEITAVLEATVDVGQAWRRITGLPSATIYQQALLTLQAAAHLPARRREPHA